MRVGSIVVRCFEFEKMLAFWQQAIHYIPREPAKRGCVVLHDPEEKGANLSLDQVLEKRSGKGSRLHLDLYTNSGEGEVESLIKIGATRYPSRINPTMTLWFWKIPTVTCFVWFRSNEHIEWYRVDRLNRHR